MRLRAVEERERALDERDRLLDERRSSYYKNDTRYLSENEMKRRDKNSNPERYSLGAYSPTVMHSTGNQSNGSK